MSRVKELSKEEYDKLTAKERKTYIASKILNIDIKKIKEKEEKK